MAAPMWARHGKLSALSNIETGHPNTVIRVRLADTGRIGGEWRRHARHWAAVGAKRKQTNARCQGFGGEDELIRKKA